MGERGVDGVEGMGWEIVRVNRREGRGWEIVRVNRREGRG